MTDRLKIAPSDDDGNQRLTNWNNQRLDAFTDDGGDGDGDE